MNSKIEKIYQGIAKSLGVDRASLKEDLGPGDITEWDSFAHQALIVDLEQTFAVNLDIDEVLEMETVGDIVEIIEKKL